jgi:hypothetical protein
LEAKLINDPVVNAKRKLIEDNKLVVIRLASLWDSARPKWFSGALARSLGWRPEPGNLGDQWPTAYCDIPKTSLLALTEFTSKRLGTKTIRVVGDPALKVTRVAVIHGLAFPTLVLAQALRDKGVDVIITGETPEVDFCTNYIRDTITAGRKIGLVQVGYEKSDYPGAIEVTKWLITVFPKMPLEVQPALQEMVWRP